MTAVILNSDQEKALDEILRARAPGEFHLLTGYAGSGKTTLMQALARTIAEKGHSVCLTAPTHKAVSVLQKKLGNEVHPLITCNTVHSLLSLQPKPNKDRTEFTRKKNAQPISADTVVIDECSMVSADLMAHVRRHLKSCFVLFVGDPAQLPPVGERESQSFQIKSRSHLEVIVRQAKGNPILAAAHSIRESQGGPADWAWLKSAKAPPLGVYVPGEADEWMKKGFTSSDFKGDPDSFRYLCWTNDRVARVNRKVRSWIYGQDTDMPFMPGERAMLRAPVVRDQNVILSTNEEATVETIETSSLYFRAPAYAGLSAWSVLIPSYRILLKSDEGIEETVHMVRDADILNRAYDRLKDEASECSFRWGEYHDLRQSIAQLQSIYAMTVHTSQGSTFRNAFVDVADIRRRERANLLETQQLFYVAATRPTHALILVGA